MNRCRQMWTLFEPIHAITYFTPEAREKFEAVGLRGFWRGYFGGRAAPLGAVGAAPVTASFFSFAPSMADRAVPDVWSRAEPGVVLAAREVGAVAALGRLLADHPAEAVAEAADLLAEAAAHVDTAGRVLAAANAALDVPVNPMARLWHATTVLREHRGDGHVAALVAAGLDGCETLVWRAGMDLPRELLHPARGWTDEEWQQAADRLQGRGWIDADGRATQIAIDAHQRIEEATDDAARRPWAALGDSAADRLVEVLTPLSKSVRPELPDVNPIGLPTIA